MGGRTYSWDEPKDPYSTELLDALATASDFRVIASRAATLSVGARHADGKLRPDVSLETLRELAVCCERAGRLDEAGEVRGEVFERTRPAHDVTRIESTIECARLGLRLGERDRAISLLDEELAWSQGRGWHESASELQVRIAHVELAEGATDRALERCDLAFATARRFRLTAVKGQALAAVGVAYTLDERYGEALDILNRASLLFQRVMDQSALAKVYNNMGVVFHASNCLVDAIPFLEAGLDFSSEKADLLEMIGGLNNVIRAFEMHFFQPASHFRERAESLLADVPSLDFARMRDRTMLVAGTRVTGETATYRSDPFIVEAMLLLSAPVGVNGLWDASLERAAPSEPTARQGVGTRVLEISSRDDDLDESPGRSSSS